MNTREILLSLLLDGPMTGYDIKKVLDMDISNVSDIRISNLYPLLNQLAEEGLLKFERVDQEKRPPKKIYELTDSGRKTCMEALSTCEATQRTKSEFLFVLKFKPHLDKTRIEQLLEDRLRDIQLSMKALEQQKSQSSENKREAEAFALGLAHTLLKAEADYIDKRRENLIGSSA